MPAIGGVVSAHQNSETRGECFKIVSRASLIGCAGLALWPFLGSTQGGKPSEAPWFVISFPCLDQAGSIAGTKGVKKEKKRRRKGSGLLTTVEEGW